ncbi:MAG: hypothetical protein AB2L20_11925 [Mangrovibacterium sp.]
MKSIFTTFTGLFNLKGAPVDLLKTWQIMFDKASEREVALFQKFYSDDWFTYNTPQMGLTAEGIMGKYNLRFMATLIGDEAPTPLRRSDGFDIWTKEIPRVGHKFFMSAREYRKTQEVYESPRLSDAQKLKTLDKTLTRDIQDAYLGVKDVMDFIALQAFSNKGKAQFKPEINNPGGRTFEIDYVMPEENILTAPMNWIDANNAAVDPILLLMKIVDDAANRGIELGEVLMCQELLTWIRLNPNVRKMIKGSDRSASMVTKSELDTELEKNGIPKVTVIKRKMGIAKDGKRSSINPWNDNMIVFKPVGNIGEIQPAIEDSELMEEPDVTYFNAGNGIRVAKWRTGESTGQAFGEYTQGSGRLLPVIGDINAIISYQVRGIE